jgi:hypothetical protein
LTVIGTEALLVESATDAAVTVAVQAALNVEKIGAVNTTELPPPADRLPQPEAGLRLHASPELAGSFRAEPERFTVLLVATACAVFGDILTLIGTTVSASEIDFVLSATAVAVTVAAHDAVRLDDAGAA